MAFYSEKEEELEEERKFFEFYKSVAKKEEPSHLKESECEEDVV